MDIDYLLMLQNFRDATGGVLDGFFELVTKLGEASIVTLLVAAMYWCVDKREGIFLMLTFYYNRVINAFVKITACVYRPWILDARVTPVEGAIADATGYSFPSGHSANAASFFGGLTLKKGRNIIIKVILIVVVLLIGFSRNYLGVHTPQDVIVSLVLAAVLLFAFKYLLDWVDKNPNKDWIVLVSGAALCVILIIYAALKGYPVDYDAAGNVIVDPNKMSVDAFKNAGMGLGFIIGWFLERRFIKFSVEGKWYIRVIRYAVCIGVYFLLKEFAAPLIPQLISGGVGKAIEQFIVILYITAGAPLIINLMNMIQKKILKPDAAKSLS